MSECRDCHGEVIWAETRTGRSIPIDPSPCWDGTYLLDPDPWPLGTTPTATSTTKTTAAVQLRTCHLDTCPARENAAPTPTRLRSIA